MESERAGYVLGLHLLPRLLLLLAVSQAGKLATRVWPFTVVASSFLAISGQPNRRRKRTCVCVRVCELSGSQLLAFALIWSVKLSINTQRILSCNVFTLPDHVWANSLAETVAQCGGGGGVAKH